jgi:hypothetical protein
MSADALRPDPVEGVRAGLDGLDERPLADHVPALGHALDAIVRELDEMATRIPPAR